MVRRISPHARATRTTQSIERVGSPGAVYARGKRASPKKIRTKQAGCFGEAAGTTAPRPAAPPTAAATALAAAATSSGSAARGTRDETVSSVLRREMAHRPLGVSRCARATQEYLVVPLQRHRLSLRAHRTSTLVSGESRRELVHCCRGAPRRARAPQVRPVQSGQQPRLSLCEEQMTQYRVYCGGGKYLGDARLAGCARFKCAPTKLDNYLRLRCVIGGAGSAREVRGGGLLHAGQRDGAQPASVDYYLGFRCVRRGE